MTVEKAQASSMWRCMRSCGDSLTEFKLWTLLTASRVREDAGADHEREEVHSHQDCGAGAEGDEQPWRGTRGLVPAGPPPWQPERTTKTTQNC